MGQATAVIIKCLIDIRWRFIT